jgi:hypothetical protein
VKAFKIRPGKAAPVTVIAEPNASQRRHAQYHQDEIIHVETFTRATVHRIRQQSSLRKLLDDDQIDEDQFFAALEIASVIEKLERNASVRCASLEARVDCSGSGTNVLVERLYHVRLERAYSTWRAKLPMPRRMILDMIVKDRALKATARVHNMGWPRAKRLLGNALHEWAKDRKAAFDGIDERDLAYRHALLGMGVIAA